MTLLGGGLIKSAWLDKGAPMYQGWTATDAELLSAWELEPDTSAIVIDMTPARETVALFQLWAVSGYTDETWTPMMLHLRSLYWDEPPDKPIEEFKMTFVRDAAKGMYVRSIMYVKEDWNRGGSGPSSGTLITDEVWAYFYESQLNTGAGTSEVDPVSAWPPGAKGDHAHDASGSARGTRDAYSAPCSCSHEAGPVPYVFTAWRRSASAEMRSTRGSASSRCVSDTR